jgi:hypothetical protein
LIASRNGRPLRVLHCPWNIAGNPASLAAAERELGADSRCVVLHDDGARFPADECFAPADARFLRQEVDRYRLLWRAITWADVVHFSFGQSCLVPDAFPDLRSLSFQNPIASVVRLYYRAVWLKDLPLLKAMGKTLAVTWQGDDARQRDRSLTLYDISIAGELGDAYYPPGSDYWKRRSIERFGRYADLLYALNPDLLRVLPPKARHLPYASFDPRDATSRPPDPLSPKPLVFAHAPSHRGAKGTTHVLAAIEKLRGEGLEFRFELVEGLPRDAAIQRYAASDIVIDQLLVGWYGGLGVEAMSLGKPVIAYIRDEDLKLVAPKMKADIPVIRSSPTEIAAVMRRIIGTPRSELYDIGLKSRKFVERWDNPIEVAKQTLADYQAAKNREVLGSG